MTAQLQDSAPKSSSNARHVAGPKFRGGGISKVGNQRHERSRAAGGHNRLADNKLGLLGAKKDRELGNGIQRGSQSSGLRMEPAPNRTTAPTGADGARCSRGQRRRGPVAHDYFLVQELAISSSVRFLVSGMIVQPKIVERMQMPVNSQNTPAAEPMWSVEILRKTGKSCPQL